MKLCQPIVTVADNLKPCCQKQHGFYYIKTSHPLTLGLQSTSEQNKKIYILFSLANALHYSLPNHVRLTSVQIKDKCDNHFKIIECCPTCRRNGAVSLSACRW